MKTKRSVAWLFLLSLVFCGCEPKKQTKLGDPLPGLTPEQMDQFQAGKEVFLREFTPETGLGPLFNSVSCAECHEAPTLGGAGDEIEIHATRYVPPDTCDSLFHQGGPVIQQHATPLLQAKGVQKEQIPPDATAQAQRTTPPLFGLGLVDAIPDATILARAKPRGQSHEGIGGKANRSIDGRLGRFGRKAATATLFDFNAGAFPGEMGVTTPLEPVENTINGTPIPPDTDPAPDPEISLTEILNVHAFVQFLAPPPRSILTNSNDKVLAKRGKLLFAELKCAVCHVPEMKTGANPIKALSYKTVSLYSDLLVHDLGANLADICLNDAHPPEFRTEMLMGLRFRDQFLHDGRAKTVAEAVELHGGEAQFSADKFKTLNDYDKKALLKFLGTL
jgi:CxxC motif-containing protein (DUF1111 family)